MTWPEPMLVTRPIERKTRRLPGISTIRPTTRGRLVLAVDDEDVAHLAEPVAAGSKTEHPARRATKTLVALTVKTLPAAWKQ